MKNKVTNFMQAIAKMALTAVIMLSVFGAKAQNTPCDARFELKTDGYKIAVSSLSTLTGFEYLWNFGDGTFNKHQNAEHTYQKEGVYSVCLIVKRAPISTSTKNERGCADTVCKRVEIKAPCRLVVDFDFETRGTIAHLKSKVQSNTTNLVYKWEFGNNRTSDNPNPDFDFKQAGRYKICLTVASRDGKCHETVCKVIEIKPDPCHGLQAAYRHKQEGMKALFVSTTAGKDLIYEWTINGRKVADNESFRFEFKEPCRYTVCLIVRIKGTDCVSRVCKVVEIKKPDPCERLRAQYRFKQDGMKAFFESTTAGKDLVYEWTINGRKATDNESFRFEFKEPGRYTVCLIVHIKGTNCVSRICKVVEVKKPEPCRINAAFRFVVSGNKVALNNLSQGNNLSYVWSVDGKRVSDKENLVLVLHTGKHRVCLTATNRNGECKETYCAVIEINRPLKQTPFSGNTNPALVAENKTEATNTCNCTDDKTAPQVPEMEMAIYPNPAQETLNLTVKGAENATIIISSLNGTVYYTQNHPIVSEQAIPVAIGQLPQGYYIAKVIAADGVHFTSLKFYKQ